MARLHEPAPAIPSPRLMSFIAWGLLFAIVAIVLAAFAGGMGWL